MSKRIVISGYYGFNNIGDEAVLSGILTALRQTIDDARVTVLSANPTNTRSEHPRTDSVHRYKIIPVIRAIRRADLVISGGGSLLQDITSARSARYYLLILQIAQRLRRKTMVYAQGVGPLISESTRGAVARVLNRTNCITVRDQDSLDLLRSIGVSRPPMQVTADPAFLVEADRTGVEETLERAGLAGREIIGVSLRPWDKADGWQSQAVEGIRAAARDLGAGIVAIPMQWPGDAQAWPAQKGELMLRAHDPGKAKGMIGRCRLVVGMRLHSLIFAAGEEVPFVPLVYDPKVSSFASAAGQECGADVASMNADTLAESITKAWAEHDARAERLREDVPRMRALAVESAQIAKGLLG